jgi:hypothetical protein
VGRPLEPWEVLQHNIHLDPLFHPSKLMATMTQLSPDIICTPASPPSFPPRSLYTPHHARPPRSVSLGSGSGCSTPRAASFQSLLSRSSLTSYTTTSSLSSLPSSEGTWGGYSADNDDDSFRLDACCFSPPSPPLLSSTTPFSSPIMGTTFEEEERREADESKQAFLQLRATKVQSSLADVDREMTDCKLTKGNLEALHHWDYPGMVRRSDDEEEEETASYSPNPSVSCGSDVTVFGTVTPRYNMKGRGFGLDGGRMRGTSVCSKLSRSELRNEEEEEEEGERAVDIALEELVRVGDERDSVPVEELNVMVRWALGLLGVRVGR